MDGGKNEVPLGIRHSHLIIPISSFLPAVFFRLQQRLGLLAVVAGDAVAAAALGQIEGRVGPPQQIFARLAVERLRPRRRSRSAQLALDRGPDRSPSTQAPLNSVCGMSTTNSSPP